MSAESKLLPVATRDVADEDQPLTRRDLLTALEAFAPAAEKFAEARSTAEKEATARARIEAQNRVDIGNINGSEQRSRREHEGKELLLSGVFGCALVGGFLMFDKNSGHAFPLATAVIGFISGRLTRSR